MGHWELCNLSRFQPASSSHSALHLFTACPTATSFFRFNRRSGERLCHNLLPVNMPPITLLRPRHYESRTGCNMRALPKHTNPPFFVQQGKSGKNEKKGKNGYRDPGLKNRRGGGFPRLPGLSACLGQTLVQARQTCYSALDLGSKIKRTCVRGVVSSRGTAHQRQYRRVAYHA